MSYYRRGEHKSVKAGRAARVRVGNHMSAARRQAVLRAVADRFNTGKVTTAGYLASIGADPEFVRRFCGPFGAAVAKVYREQHGAEPAREGLDVRGRRLVRVNSYRAADAAVLAQGARNYRRTAELLDTAPAAEPVATVTALRTGITPAALAAEAVERYAVPADFAAAQADFEARIRSAIEPDLPTPPASKDT